jgi:ethanolaminephosphotransferase
VQWTACVELLPLWLAPNTVTLLGFFCVVANVVLLVLIMPGMDGEVCSPAVPYVCCGG